MPRRGGFSASCARAALVSHLPRVFRAAGCSAIRGARGHAAPRDSQPDGAAADVRLPARRLPRCRLFSVDLYAFSRPLHEMAYRGPWRHRGVEQPAAAFGQHHAGHKDRVLVERTAFATVQRRLISLLLTTGRGRSSRRNESPKRRLMEAPARNTATVMDSPCIVRIGSRNRKASRCDSLPGRVGRVA